MNIANEETHGLGQVPYTTLAPFAPSAGAAAASHICFGRLLPALYLKLGTFLPSPFSAISPLPPLPDLHDMTA